MQNQLEVQKLEQEIGELCEGEKKSSEDWDKYREEVGKRIDKIKKSGLDVFPKYEWDKSELTDTE